MAAERVEAVLESLTYTRGVLGTVVCTLDGTPIRDSFQNLDRSIAIGYCQVAAELARTAAGLFAGDLAKRAEAINAHASSSSGGGRTGKQKGGDEAAAASSVPLLRESALELMRVCTRNNELIVQCSDEFLLVIVQEPVDL